jgi:multiple sugar transport system ATP-binding protein
MGAIKLENIRKSFGPVEVIKSVNLDIDDGEFVVFVGPSGCGKSTMLRIIAGLEEPSFGRIEIDGKEVTGVAADRRGLAMVFQSYALYPHMTVRENMAFSLSIAGVDKAIRDEAVNTSAEILQLGPLLDRKPRDLSGGQRQRVAIGRAIVRNPLAFLFDEPLSNLDAALRVQMRIELARLHKRLGRTMIYVTHDQVEAMTLADRIVVFNGGAVQQQGRPLELYERPANLFVATFIGSPKMNVLPYELCGGLRLDVAAAEATPAHVGIRPEHIRLSDPSEAQLVGTVDVVEHVGSDSFVYVAIEGIDTSINVRAAGSVPVAMGTRVGLQFDDLQLHLFNMNGDRLNARREMVAEGVA